MTPYRFLWAASVLLMTIGLILLGLAVGAGASEGGKYRPDEECWKVEYEDGVYEWTNYGSETWTITIKAGTTSETYEVAPLETVSHSTGKAISHVIVCRPPTPTTTTTIPSTTTTSSLPTTTTVPVTTTTVPPTTTSLVTTTTTPSCGPGSPLWNERSQTCELPFTGVSSGALVFLAWIGGSLFVSGLVSVLVARAMGSTRDVG